MNELNILQINSSKVLGGGEVYLQQLTEGLINKKHNITLAIRNEISNYFSNFNAEIEVLPLKNALDFISILKLAKIIKNKDIDIIHVHTGKDYWLGTTARNLVGRGKVVATRHIVTPLGKSYFHRKLYSSIDKFIAVSKQVKDILVDENGLPSKKIEVIYNGVNTNKFNLDNTSSQNLKEELGISNKEVVIGTVGRLAEEKNQKLLIKAISKLKDRMSSDFKCLIVGEDNSPGEKYKAEIENLICDFNLEEEVSLTGFKKDIPSILNMLDILIIPSKKEAFGMVAIEAMAVKTPIITSEVGGLKEVVKEGVNGLLFKVDDENELTNKMISLIYNSKLREELGEKGYNLVLNNFKVEDMIDNVESLYLQLI